MKNITPLKKTAAEQTESAAAGRPSSKASPPRVTGEAMDSSATMSPEKVKEILGSIISNASLDTGEDSIHSPIKFHANEEYMDFFEKYLEAKFDHIDNGVRQMREDISEMRKDSSKVIDDNKATRRQVWAATGAGIVALAGIIIAALSLFYGSLSDSREEMRRSIDTQWQQMTKESERQWSEIKKITDKQPPPTTP